MSCTIVWCRYELHEWVYQLHNSLDEFKKKQHGVYAIVSNATSSGSSQLTDFKLYPTQDHQEQESESQGVYAVVKKPKPIRQAPPVPPRSKEMTIMSDDAPSDSAIESVTGAEGDSGVQSRATLMSFGSGSDFDLSHRGRHKRSLSDSFIIGKVDKDMVSELPAANRFQASSSLKKMSSDTDLASGKLQESSGFQLPESVKRKKVYKRRKTIATSSRKRQSHSPPLEPPPPPPGGDSRPEVNQAIIEALYALDEELGQNTSPSPATSAVAPTQIDHTTLFATFQSPTESEGSPILSSTTGSMLSPVNRVVDDEPALLNDGMTHQGPNGHATVEDVDFQAKRESAKNRVFTVTGEPSTEVPLTVRKVPPPVKPKPKPKPPQRTTSYKQAAELHENTLNTLLSSLQETKSSESAAAGSSSEEKREKKPVGQTAEVHSPQIVFPPQDTEKKVNGRVLTTFSLDDLSKDAIELSKKRGVPLSPKVPNSTGTTITLYNKSSYPDPVQTTVSISHIVSKHRNSSQANKDQKAKVVEEQKEKQTTVSERPITTSAAVTTPTHHAAVILPAHHSTVTPPTHHTSPSKSSSIAISTIFQSVVGDMLPSSEASLTTTSTTSTTSTSTLHNSGSEESMTKIFQNWPKSLSPSSEKSPSNAAEIQQWKDSQAHQHIYDDPWDSKMIGDQLSQSSLMRAGDRNSLERRGGGGSNNQSPLSNSGRMREQQWKDERGSSSQLQLSNSGRMREQQWKDERGSSSQLQLSNSGRMREQQWKDERGSSNQSQLSNSGRAKAGDRNSLERRTTIAGPRRGASIENLFKKPVKAMSTEDLNAGLKKKGASTENLSKMDPTSPLYLYKKALRNHEQQVQQEKEKSYTLPLKGDKFANVVSKTMGDRRFSQQSLPAQQSTSTQSSQASVRPRANTSTRLFQSMQNINGDRKVSMPQQHPPLQHPHPQYTRLQATQQPRRTASNVGYYPKNSPGYKPFVLNANVKPPTSIDHNPTSLSRRDSNKSRPTVAGNPHMAPNRRQDDWRYVKPGTQMAYDRDSDSTILRSLV